jgi:hypothetical protein
MSSAELSAEVMKLMRTKVLHGEIEAAWFDSLTPPGPNIIGQPAKPFKKHDHVDWTSELPDPSAS